jgi:hypothetical protein
MNKFEVFDNFLHHNDFELLKDTVYFNQNFPFFLSNSITYTDKNSPDYNDENIKKIQNQPWCWYGTHMIYEDDQPRSKLYEMINEFFIFKFKSLGIFKSLIRVKANFYPYTEKLKENISHTDYPYSHYAAVFSINTCDGFTRMFDKTKIDSIENRLVLFDGSLPHNSTTTSTNSGRFNINFNFL